MHTVRQIKDSFFFGEEEIEGDDVIVLLQIIDSHRIK